MQVFNRNVSVRGLTVFGFEIVLISGSMALAASLHGGFNSAGAAGSMLSKIIVVTALCQLCFYYNDLYDLTVVHSNGELVVRLLQAAGAAAIVLAFTCIVFPTLMFDPSTFVTALGVFVVAVLTWRLAFNHFAHEPYLEERVLIVAPLRGIASILGGSVAGQGVVILSYPLLTRLYAPSEFGLLTVFTSTVILVAVLSTAALDGAIPLPPDDRDAAAIAWAALTFVAATSLVTAIVGALAAEPLAALLGVPQLAEYWWLVALMVLAVGTDEVLTDWMVRGRSYGALGLRNTFQGVGQVVTQVGLGLAGVRPLGLLLGLGAGRLAALGGLASRVGLLRQPRPTLRAMRAMVGRFRRFPLLALPSSFVNRAGLEMPLLLTSAIYGDVRAGLLGLTVRVIAGPLATVGQAVYQVFAGESSAAVRDARGTLGAGVRGAVRRLLLVGILPAAVLIAFGPALFGLRSGRNGRRPASTPGCSRSPTSHSSRSYRSPRRSSCSSARARLAWAGARLLLTSAGPAVCGVLEAPIIVAIAALAVGQTLSYFALHRLCVRAADASDQRYRDQTT